MNKRVKKLLWFLLLFFDLIVFEQGIVHSNVPSLLLAAVLAGIINFKGNNTMFGDFERQQKKKIEARKKDLVELQKSKQRKGIQR